MEINQIQMLTATFEVHAKCTKSGVEYWLARDLQYLLGYAKWDNFLNVIGKAKTACKFSGHAIADHFADVGKMVDLGSGSQREISDISNNRAVRQTLLNRGIRPESLPPAEDVKKVERRLSSDEKKALQTAEKLEGA